MYIIDIIYFLNISEEKNIILMRVLFNMFIFVYFIIYFGFFFGDDIEKKEIMVLLMKLFIIFMYLVLY